MKRSLFAIVAIMFTLSGTSVFADQKSDQVLSSLKAKIASLGNYRVEFRATAEGTRSDGEYVVSGDKYYIKVDDAEVISDGKVKYEVNHADQEVMIDRVNPKDRNILTNPTKAFDFADYMFSATYVRQTSGKGPVCDVISLKPLDAYSSIKNIELWINLATGLPALVKYTADGLSGDVVVEVHKFVSQTAPVDGLFRFDPKKFPGYEMVDFR